MMPKVFTTIVFLIVTAKVLNGQESKMQAHFIKDEIELDGILNENAWQEAAKISDFTQRELNYGEAATERTEVAVLLDHSNIYIGVWCYDSRPDRLTAKELQLDFEYELDDNFIVVLDTYHDERNGFLFATNPIAARADAQIFNNGGSVNPFWNGIWNVKTSQTQEGWFAEFKIPFIALKFKRNDPNQVWGINFERNIQRNREQVRWKGWNRNYEIEQVSQAGDLVNLKLPANNQFVEIKPYALAGADYSGDDKDQTYNVGGDINYLITPNYRLNLTANTDFAQVEADQQQINITRFPLFFPELREFFLEGQDYFDMGFGGNRIIPFYTRRIGLNDARESIPIIGGARLLGKSQNSTLGLMSIQTGKDGEFPSSNYTVGSWRQDLGGQSIIGAMSANEFKDGRWHTTTGINGQFTNNNFLGDKNINLGGAAIKSHNSEDEWQAESYAYRFFAGYPNDKITVFTSTQRSPEAFNAEIGLMRRRNFRENFFLLALTPRPNQKGALGWIRQFNFRPAFLTHTKYDDTRDLQTFEYLITFLGVSTRSGEDLNMNYAIRAEGLVEDFEIRPGLTIPRGTYWWREWQFDFQSFQGRSFSLESNLNFGDFYDGTSIRSTNTLLWRTSKYLNLALLYEYNNIQLPDGTFDSNLFSSRMRYALSPNVFGSLLSQWNTQQEELNFNFRLQIIPKIGANFFLIVNQIYDTKENSIVSERGTIIGKLIWRLAI
jgi:hypothetical protein